MAWQAWGNAGIIFANGEEQATNRRLSNPAFFRADLLGVTHAIVLDLSECVFLVLFGFVVRLRVFWAFTFIVDCFAFDLGWGWI